MKRNTITVIMGCVLLAAALFAAQTYAVKVRTSALRSGPKFFASSLLNVKTGDGLLLLKREADWLQVKAPGGQVGWIHVSAVEPKKIDILAWNKSTKNQASATEVAMAAKGFNKQVESSYRARNKNISFVWVDKMARMAVGRAQLEAFLRQGRLGEFRGVK
ncbi:MAG: SH3 domain-containing protein [Candidatus Aminicenantes bacterium]|nr:SH3 domain-containing protein [Candidatus Aminicenantes bacterium]